MQEPPDVADVLGHDRVVQPELGADLVQWGLRGPQADDLAGRVTGCHLQDEEHQQDDAQEQRDGQEQPLEDEPEPSHRLSP